MLRTEVQRKRACNRFRRPKQDAHDEIYGSAFGVELDDLFGESLIYAISEIDRRYSDALLRDDRTTSVSNFEFKQLANNKLAVSFTVGTIYGDLEESTVI